MTQAAGANAGRAPVAVAQTRGGYAAASDAVRECLRLAGLDSANVGTAAWNPLGRWIQPGMRVVLKPNWVSDRHPRDASGWEYTVTHGRVLGAVAEYVARALAGRGSILVCDGPQTDSSFAAVAALTGAEGVSRDMASRGLRCDLVDLRREQWHTERGVVVDRRALPGDPAGYVEFDLGRRSRLVGRNGEGRYYGADYDSAHLNRHHSGGRHAYLIARSPIAADVFINLPKLKTHKKTGLTLSLKNLVGINGDKNYLPHHTEGDPSNGGDQFPAPSLLRSVERHGGRFARRLALGIPVLGPRILRRIRTSGLRVAGDTETTVRSGNWHGNDTTWRMALDLNACLLWGEPDARFRPREARKPYLSLVDGIVAGEGAGPLNPDPVPLGLVAFGENPADVDATCAWLVGFDPDRLPLIREAYRPHDFPVAEGSWTEVTVRSNRPEWNGRLDAIPLDPACRLRPHFGWTGAVERKVG